MDDGYSGNYPTRHTPVYDDGVSYGRGRGAKRDMMGRYSRGDAKQEYIEELRELMHNAPDEATRQSIQHMIDQMDHG